MQPRLSSFPSLRAIGRLAPDFVVPGGALYTHLAPIHILDVGNMDRAAYAALLDKVDELVIAPRNPYVIITDTRRLENVPGADVRKLLSEWMRKNTVNHTSLGSATIIRSTVVRGALTALYWLFEPPTPQRISADWADAQRWAVERFDEANVPLRPTARGASEQPY